MSFFEPFAGPPSAPPAPATPFVFDPLAPPFNPYAVSLPAALMHARVGADGDPLLPVPTQGPVGGARGGDSGGYYRGGDSTSPSSGDANTRTRTATHAYTSNNATATLTSSPGATVIFEGCHPDGNTGTNPIWGNVTSNDSENNPLLNPQYNPNAYPNAARPAPVLPVSPPWAPVVNPMAPSRALHAAGAGASVGVSLGGVGLLAALGLGAFLLLRK